MVEKRKENFRIVTVLFLFFCFIGNNLFGAKISDYVNKSDVENAKKIFIYEVPKKVQADKNRNNENNQKNSGQNDKNTNKNKIL